MASLGNGYFDTKGAYYKTPEEATISDLANALGRIGDGDDHTYGLAKMLLEKRAELESIFADHDEMMSINAIKPMDFVAAIHPIRRAE
jgi:hypothetical protein